MYSLNEFNLNVIDPVAFSIGNQEIRWYGIMIFFGFLVAIILACVKLAKWYKIPYDPFFYFCILGIPVAILGARLWSFIIGDATVTTNFFADYWNFASGGLAIQGGIIATAIAGLIWFPLILRKPKYQIKTKLGEKMYVRQISSWVYADVILPCVLIGQVIGRWGNFFNQEVYGPEVDEQSMQWLLVLMPDVYEQMKIGGTMYHPFFLYESFFNFWFFLGLYIGGEFIRNRKAGDLALAYFVCYGILRLCMEPFRFSGTGNNKGFYYPFSIVTSVFYLLFGIAFIVLNHFYFYHHRDTKLLYKSWVHFAWFFKKIYINLNKGYKEKIKRIDPQLIKFGYAKKPQFQKTETEIFFYNGF